ncbi:MAG: hypothetical protein HFK06_05170 [Clostridia bacterium]|jgi:tetratricopeptide (TPR) repeat protein|nr:hypothetical protein [Clostridia bacterium]
MNKKNLELFGLGENATKEEVSAAYDNLRAKYLEERFMDGEVGNNAAKMLTQIDVAYNDLMREFSESATADDAESSFAKVEELIKANDISEAQRVLDGFNERGGRWHYLQSVIFYRKNWINESKKQLEIAIQLEPENEKYKETYRKLNEKLNYDAQNAGDGNQTVYQGQTMSSGADNQMGGNFCANCIECCYINMCINCLCNACCH